MAERLTQVASAHQKIAKVVVHFVDGTMKEIDSDCIMLSYGKTEKVGSEYRTHADTILSANMAFASAVTQSVRTHVDSWEEQNLLASVRKASPEAADFLDKLFKRGDH